jgi:hypothetical protein
LAPGEKFFCPTEDMMGTCNQVYGHSCWSATKLPKCSHRIIAWSCSLMGYTVRASYDVFLRNGAIVRSLDNLNCRFSESIERFFFAKIPPIY